MIFVRRGAVLATRLSTRSALPLAAACRGASSSADELRAALAAAREAAAAQAAHVAALSAHVAALSAQLDALQPAFAASAAARGVRRSLLSFPAVSSLVSPSTAASSFLDDDFVALTAAPVSVPAGVDPAVAPAFAALLEAAGGDPREMMAEKTLYHLASTCLPRFAENIGNPRGEISASALFGTASLRTRSWRFAECKPELHVRARIGGSEPAFRPAFNGAVKTAGDKRALEQAAYYTAMDMVRVFFPARERGTEPCVRRYFARPPLGFALVAFPHVGYFIALEMIGKLLVSPASAPFFLGSAAHAEAAAALPDERFEDPRGIDGDGALEWLTPAAAEGAARDRAAWSKSGGVFRKLVRGDARSGAAFADMHRAYERLAEVLPGAPPALGLVPSARLLYGAHEVLVEMPAVDGREASDAEVTGAGPVLEGAAAAVAWLARRGLVYADLRGPNVLVDARGAARLVDFDDIAVGAPVNSAAAFRAALARTPGAVVQGTFAARFCAGALPAVEAALARAFGL